MRPCIHISDGSRVLPDVQDGKLQLNHTLHYRTADPSELRSLTVTFEWTNELIAPDELYTKDRPSSVYMELSRNSDAAVVAHRSSAPEDGVAVFENLPIRDDNGNEITYVLTTTTLQHYDAQVTRTDTGFHITSSNLNKHTWETTRTEPTCTVDGSIVSVCQGLRRDRPCRAARDRPQAGLLRARCYVHAVGLCALHVLAVQLLV